VFKVVVLDGSFAVWSEKHGEEIATGLTLAQAQAEVDALTIDEIAFESHTPEPVPCTFRNCYQHECSYCGQIRRHQPLMPICDCSDLIAEDGSDDVLTDGGITMAPEDRRVQAAEAAFNAYAEAMDLNGTPDTAVLWGIVIAARVAAEAAFKARVSERLSEEHAAGWHVSIWNGKDACPECEVERQEQYENARFERIYWAAR
jgi:hypothetical protein